jgi:two-component system, cell cycle sensor histidine kinase and response regulator CckA
VLIDRSEQVLVERAVELNELVSNADRMLRPLLGERLRLVTELSCQPLHVLTDASQLERAIIQLVIKARDASSETGRIELATGRHTAQARDPQKVGGWANGDYAWLNVRDRGASVSDDEQQRLLEPFRTILSRDEQGTLIRVLLPLVSGADAVPASSGVVPAALSLHRVLVVEDEPQVRAIAMRALTNAGFEVQQAANGALGLTLLKQQRVPFDVVVTDVVMPELSGPDLARAARAFDRELGIVFMSGFPAPMHDAHAAEFAGAAFLAKPFGPRALVQAVRDCIERRGAVRRFHD